MRRRLHGLGVAAAALLGGCHWITGFDDLVLREDAELVWRAPLAGKGDAVVEALGLASSGQVLAIGRHDGPLVLGATTLEGAGDGHAFVAALSPDGRVTAALALDATGTVRPVAAAGGTVFGVYSGLLTIGSKSLAAPTSPAALFLVDVDATSGDVTRALSLGGPEFAAPDGKLDVARDTTGNLVVGGSYLGSLALPGCSTYPTKTKPNLFLAKLAPDGQCLWTVSNDDGAPQAIESVAVDELNDFVVVGGEFVGRLSFGATSPLQNSGGVDFFLARFDGDGKLEWAKGFGNGLVQGSARVAAAPGGFTALGGFFEGTLDVGGEPLVATRGHDVLVANFRPNGELEWQRQIRVDRPACATMPCALDELDVAFDPEGNLFVAVPFAGTADLDGVTVSAGPRDAATLLARFDRSGNLLWSGALADPESPCEERGHCRVSLAIDPARDVLLGGTFARRLDLGGVTALGEARQLELESEGGLDGFVAKFRR